MPIGAAGKILKICMIFFQKFDIFRDNDEEIFQNFSPFSSENSMFGEGSQGYQLTSGKKVGIWWASFKMLEKLRQSGENFEKFWRFFARKFNFLRQSGEKLHASSKIFLKNGDHLAKVE